MPGKDVESPEEAPLLKKRYPWLCEYEFMPVGGLPGNHRFLLDVTLAFRTTFFACCLSVFIWSPKARPYIDPGFLPFIPISILMIFFGMNRIFGIIVGNSCAAIIGTFWACFNIFMLRGFFPDGVTPEMGTFSPASVVGYTDWFVFNFLFLSTDLRMGVRMFAMAGNTGYMLAFLNPQDQSVYSKNFKINPNGIAVSNLKVTVLACILTMLANLLPVPFGFAEDDMKANAKRAAAFVAKKFISSTDYYRGSKRTIAIEKEIAGTALVDAEVGGLGAAIGGAWYEGFDIGVRGTIRKLHEEQAGLLGTLVNVIKAVEIAISTEDFGPSHRAIMAHCGDACSALVEEAGDLLMICTYAASDGELSPAERDELEAKIQKVDDKKAALAKAFNAGRQDPNLFEHSDEPRSPNPVDNEMLNESFFVFAISAYARHVTTYADMLAKNPPMGESVGATFGLAIKGTFNLSGVGANHGVFVIRSMIAATIGFIYAVTLDNYSGACAITMIFFLSDRVAPDVLSAMNGLAASTIASVVGGSIIYVRVCGSGNGNWMLPLVAFFYWWGGLYVGFSGCKFASIGLLCAALSPFVLVVQCPDPSQTTGTAGALGMWLSIQGFVLSLGIITVCEYFSTSKPLAAYAVEHLEKAMKGIEDALTATFDDRDPAEGLAVVGGNLGDARMFSGFAVLEPRKTKCVWKHGLLMEVADLIALMKLDIQFMHHAMTGSEGVPDGIFDTLNDVPQWEDMSNDLANTFSDARNLVLSLLRWEEGVFTMPDDFVIDGLDDLDGFEDAVRSVNEVKGVVFPDVDADIPSMEDDLLCQISIIFVMLDYVNKRFAGVSRASVRES